MFYKILAVTILLGVGTTNPSWAQDQACVDIARIGLVDKETMQTLEDRIERIFLYTRSQKDSTSSEVDKLSASAHIPLGDILVGASGAWSEEEYQRVRQMDERTFKHYVHDMVARYSDRATANKDVAAVVNGCLNRSGFAAWPSFGPGNYRSPALTLSYRAPPELEGQARVLDVTLSYPPKVSCSTGSSKPTTKVKLKSENPLTLRCTHDSGDADSALVIVNPNSPTTMLTGGDVWFPPTVEQLPKCTVAKAERLEITVHKFQDWTKEIGPYCNAVLITMSAKAEAKAQPGTQGASSELVVYKVTDKPDLFINDRKDLRTAAWEGLGTPTRSLDVPAYKVERFLLQIKDRLADTEQGLWVIEVQPTNAR